MFDSFYPTLLLSSQHRSDAPSRVEHSYRFVGKNGTKYIVKVDQFEYSVYIVKFFLAHHKNNQKKYNLLSNLNECPRVLGTIGHILRGMLEKDRFASFGFIGSPLPGEEKGNSKRFKLYRRLVEEKISSVDFDHYQSPNCSAYLLLNRSKEEDNLFNKVKELFEKYYILD